MGRSAVLLRGVNVGGVKLRMAEVATCLREAGYGDVRTVLASGNVLLDSSRDPATDKATIEASLRKRFGYEAWVHVLRLPELERIVEDYPFEADRDGWHDYVIVTTRPELAAEIVATDTEHAAPGDGVVYWTVPKGDTLSSAVGRLTSKARFAEWTTTRNLRTLRRLLA